MPKAVSETCRATAPSQAGAQSPPHYLLNRNGTSVNATKGGTPTNNRTEFSVRTGRIGELVAQIDAVRTGAPATNRPSRCAQTARHRHNWPQEANRGDSGRMVHRAPEGTNRRQTTRSKGVPKRAGRRVEKRGISSVSDRPTAFPPSPASEGSARVCN